MVSLLHAGPSLKTRAGRAGARPPATTPAAPDPAAPDPAAPDPAGRHSGRHSGRFDGRFDGRLNGRDAPPDGGCLFRDRCPHAMSVCGQPVPVFPLVPGHSARCWLYAPDPPTAE